MSEFVEDGLDIIVSEEGGFIPDGCIHVAGDQSTMRREVAVRQGLTGDHICHPCTGTLVTPWEPVGLEGAQVPSCLFIGDTIDFDLGVPCIRLRIETLDVDAEESPG